MVEEEKKVLKERSEQPEKGEKRWVGEGCQQLNLQLMFALDFSIHLHNPQEVYLFALLS